MLCGMGLQRFALSRLPRNRLLLGLAGIAPTIVVTGVVTDPGLLLGLTAAILVGYAIVVSPAIVRVRERSAHERRPAAAQRRSDPGQPPAR